MKTDAKKFFFISLTLILAAAVVGHRSARDIGSTTPAAEQASVINTAEKPPELAQRATTTAENDLVHIVRVIDGDTIVVGMNEQQIHVRLIGINSPELKDKRPRVACFAEKAKEEAMRLLDGQNVKLEKDPTQGDYDKYGRTLAYIFLSGGSTSLTASGTDFNKLMIKEGYAYEYTYHLPYRYQKEYKAAQADARAAKRGLWGNSLCAN